MSTGSGRAARGVELTGLGFGGAQAGNLYAAVSDDVVRAAVDAAWDGGLRYFDTAPHYGLGLSERRLGAALAARPRDQYVLSTKVGRLLVPSAGTARLHRPAGPRPAVHRVSDDHATTSHVHIPTGAAHHDV